MQADQSQYPEVTRDQYSDFVSNPLWKRIRMTLIELKNAAVEGLRKCPADDINLHRATLNVIDSILELPEGILEEINEEDTNV